MPQVSVILSSYNHGKYIAEAIDSILAQTFTDFELLIFDDGSNDDSREIIRSFDDERIKLFLYEKNRGPLAAGREPLLAADGEFIAVHHSDDVWEKDKLREQVDFFRQNPSYTACFTQVSFIDENSQPYNLPAGHLYAELFNQANRDSGGWLRRFFYHGNCFCHPSLLVRREPYREIMLNPIHGVYQLPDSLAWIRLLLGGQRLYVLDKPLTKFRLNRRLSEQNVSAESPGNLLRLNWEFIPMLREYAKLSPELFRAAFPEQAQFIFDGRIDFALAKACLSAEFPAFHLYGLNLLQGLLNEPLAAKILRERFDYNEGSFAREVGDTDCFNLRQNMHFARMSVTLFYDNESEVSVEQTQYVRHNGNFTAEFKLKPGRQTKKIQFVPDRDLLFGIYLTDCSLNDRPLVLKTEAGKIGDYYFAETGTLSFAADVDLPADVEARFTVSGVFWRLTPPDILNVVQEHNEHIAALQADLTACREALNEAVDLNQKIVNSASWRVTSPLRKIKRLWKCGLNKK